MCPHIFIITKTKTCQGCKIEKPVEEFYWRESRQNYSPKCKICWIESCKQYNNDHKEHLTQYYSQYHKKNREKKKILRRNDPKMRIASNLRNRLYKAVTKKFQGIMFLVGCELDELLLYLEQQFDGEMTWNNYGTYWEIDHIKPCDSFNLNDLNEQFKCFHYTNLQPLTITENRKKSNKHNG